MKGEIKGRPGREVYLIDGLEVTKAEFDEAFPDKPIGVSALCHIKPKLSDALAVHPDDCEKAEAEAKARGVPTEFERGHGRPKITSRAHQKAYLKAFGFHNKDGGYGD